MTTDPITGRPALRPAVSVAALGSAAAGLVHAAAAGTHEGDPALVWLFATWAALQLGWGWTVATSADLRRPVLLAGLAINAGAVGVWALSRTVGIGLLSSLAAPERVGTQDLTAAGFAAVSVGAVVWLLAGRSAQSTQAWPGALAAGAFVLVLPALVAGHAHDAAGHSEAGVAAAAHGHTAAAGDEAGHAHTAADGAAEAGHGHTAETSTSTAVGGHDHTSDAPGEASGHDHPAASGTTDDSSTTHGHSDTTDTTVGHDHLPTTTTTTTVGHDHGGGGGGGSTEPPITSLDDPRLTEAQVNAAVSLIVGTLGGMQGFGTVEDIEAAGYESIGDGGQPGEYTHYVSWSSMTDAYELDPSHIESITVKTNADGTTRVVAAMYSLTFGDGMDDVPDIAGSLTTWHDHDTFCFDGSGFVALAVAGSCPTGALLDTPPMLHVWVEDNPCGPFADVEVAIDACDTGHGH